MVILCLESRHVPDGTTFTEDLSVLVSHGLDIVIICRSFLDLGVYVLSLSCGLDALVFPIDTGAAIDLILPCALGLGESDRNPAAGSGNQS